MKKTKNETVNNSSVFDSLHSAIPQLLIVEIQGKFKKKIKGDDAEIKLMLQNT